MNNETGTRNIAIGSSVMVENIAGCENTATGAFAMALNSTGGYNSAYGYGALFSNTTGTRNTAIGYNAGMHYGSHSYCTLIGHEADVLNTFDNATAIGNYALATASNQVRIGNSSVTEIGGQVGWTTLSDKRIKKNIEENVAGLSFIKKLRPVTYTLDKDKQDKIMGRIDSSDMKSKYDIESIHFSGFIAQEVEEAANETGYDFSAVKKPANEKDLYGLTYSEFVVPLVKAVQELALQNENLEIQVTALMQEIEGLKKKRR